MASLWRKMYILLQDFARSHRETDIIEYNNKETNGNMIIAEDNI